MNQPVKPVPPRSARPQLFSAAATPKRQPDFGPSILATIDGGQAKIARPRGRSSRRGLLMMAALLLLAGVVLVVARLGMTPSPAISRVAVEAAPTMRSDLASTGPAAAVAAVAEPASASMPQGGAMIETVASVAPVAANAASAPASASASQSTSVASSLGSIKQALERSESPVASPAKKAPMPEAVHAVNATQTEATAPAATAKRSSKGNTGVDDDAELLAAMLPHLQRTHGGPNSPAFEKRCGQLMGEAAAECRAKFCNGRQGVDAACPLVGPVPR